jgi:hypothetical protein
LRKIREHKLPNTLTQEDWEHALAYFNGRCAVCDRPPGLFHTLSMDHWIPLNHPDCPGTTPQNIVPLCHGIDGCNGSKHAQDPLIWLIKRYGEKKGRAKFKAIETYLQSL